MKGIESMNGKIFSVSDKIKLKFKLLDSKVIHGIHIDRSKNYTASYYDVEEKPD